MKVRTVFIIVFLLTGCSLLSTEESNRLTGSWDWLYSQGGFGGWTLTPESEGYSQQLTFFGNRFYVKTRNDTLFKQGTYSLSKIEFDGKKRRAITFESKVNQAVVLQQNDTLRLFENCADCYLHVYVRDR